tara:strand:+ start:788 stop:3358 length:2571 start_codon:yes stop_codon:yes gene_type:complete
MDRKKIYKGIDNNNKYKVYNMKERTIQEFFNEIEKEHNLTLYRHIDITYKDGSKIQIGERNNMSVAQIGKNRYGYDFDKKRVLKESECNTLSLAVKHIPDLYVVDFDTKNIVDCELYDILNDDCVAFTETTKGSHYYIKIKNIGDYSHQTKVYIDPKFDVDLIKTNNIWETKGRIIKGEIKEYDWNNIKKYFKRSMPPAKPAKKSQDNNTDFDDPILLNTNVDLSDISEILNDLESKECYEYEQWWKIGMCIFNMTTGSTEGMKLWDEWSQKDPREGKYSNNGIITQWNGWLTKDQPFKKIGLSTLKRFRTQYGPITSPDAYDEIFKKEVLSLNPKTKDEYKEAIEIASNGKMIESMNKILHFIVSQSSYIYLYYTDHRKDGDKDGEIRKKNCWVLKNKQDVFNFFEKYEFDYKYTSIDKGKESYHPQTGELISMDNIKTTKINIKPFSLWAKSMNRKEFMEIGFDPHPNASPSIFNLWKGYQISKDESELYPVEEAQPILNHIFTKWCNSNQTSYDYIMNLFAHYIQKPHIKTGVLLSLKSKEGGGKGIILKKLEQIIGDDHYAQNSNADYLFGNFNSQLEGKILINLDEAYWGGDKKMEGIIKNKITESRQQINKKNKDVYEINDYCNYIITTNCDWFVSCSESGRRVYALELNNDLSGIKTKEIQNQIKEVINAPAEAFANILYNRDISEFDPRIFEKTSLVQEQVEQGWKSVKIWWANVLEKGGFNYNNKFVEWNKSDEEEYDEWKKLGIWKKRKTGERVFFYIKESLFDSYNSFPRSSHSQTYSHHTFLKELKNNCLGDLWEEYRITKDYVKYNVLLLPPLEEARKMWNKQQQYKYQYDDSITSSLLEDDE